MNSSAPWKAHFRIFAGYNRWANERIYKAAAELTPEALRQDRGGFFKSVLGCLNHLVLVDRLWMSRLEGNSPRGVRLDEMLYPDIGDLRTARAAEDERIIAYVSAIQEEQFAALINYQTTSGADMSQPLRDILAHFFNHQTHHRGQAHDLIGQAAGIDEAPVLDLLAYQRQVAKG